MIDLGLNETTTEKNRIKFLGGVGILSISRVPQKNVKLYRKWTMTAALTGRSYETKCFKSKISLDELFF